MTSERTDRPTALDERTMLTTFLDYTRATVHAKCEGLTDELAHLAPIPTSPLMSIGGVVSHLRWVETWWFETVFLGRPDTGPWTDDEPDREMSLGAVTPIAELLADYEREAVKHRELVAQHDLEDLAKTPGRDGERMSLKWILHHLIEETARHNGHLDLLREMVDGVTGE